VTTKSQTERGDGDEHFRKHHGRDFRSWLGASERFSNGGTKRAAAQTVDVAAIVDKAAAATGEKLAWRTSIVDLMKALNLDSSLAARKQLASELKYTGDTNDSATMNVWLHKQIMARLAANGGKLPGDIKT
jgi:hypothetical protein